MDATICIALQRLRRETQLLVPDEAPLSRINAMIHRQIPTIGIVAGTALPTGITGMLTVMATAASMTGKTMATRLAGLLIAGKAGLLGLLIAGNIGAIGHGVSGLVE